MRRPCCIDNRMADGEQLPEGLYVYQNIRTQGCRPLCTERHVDSLRRAAAEVLCTLPDIDDRTVARSITSLLERGGYPSDMASYATVRYYASGQTVILGGDILPYARISIRTVYPRGAVVDYDPPFSDYPSSLSLAALQAARIRARAAGAEAVIRRNTRGLIASAEESPLFAVCGDEVVVSSATVSSAEFDTACKAIAAAGLTLRIDDLTAAGLEAADEAFFIDHRGITALSRCGERTYMHLLAHRIAKHL